ncbi:MAG: hypothetical protein JJU00_04730 [Opitutales bacterium]|nr:hypothetical protein [Opitutales bacterium]
MRTLSALMEGETTDHYRDYCGGVFKVVSVVLTFVFWVIFTVILSGFVPVQTAFWQYVWGGFTALSMAGVFFVAVHMFWLVVGEQRRARL